MCLVRSVHVTLKQATQEAAMRTLAIYQNAHVIGRSAITGDDNASLGEGVVVGHVGMSSCRWFCRMAGVREPNECLTCGFGEL